MSDRQPSRLVRPSILIATAFILLTLSTAQGSGGYWAPYTMGGTSLAQMSRAGEDDVRVRRELRQFAGLDGPMQPRRLRGLVEPGEEIQVAIHFRLPQDAKDVVISDSLPAGCEVRFTPASTGLSTDLVELFQWLGMRPLDDEEMLKELGVSATDGKVRFEMPEMKAGRYEVSYLLTPTDRAGEAFGPATIVICSVCSIGLGAIGEL